MLSRDLPLFTANIPFTTSGNAEGEMLTPVTWWHRCCIRLAAWLLARVPRCHIAYSTTEDPRSNAS